MGMIAIALLANGKFAANPESVGSLKQVETRGVPDLEFASNLVLVGDEGEFRIVRGGIARAWALGVLISNHWNIPLVQDERFEIRAQKNRTQ